ncbi:P1 family peptidase [Pseudonocardia endophytica]|uniref:L-aminopeptidase/D-esterase-like protein n=1 Tax=Pseudonocardia endophytica TaxID=401976 RepID=A0A4R1HKM8_PSEEN|nr:P1 family peptidase [Pseudonocardia endophytica]TCK20119.1 L-aminopeptidase/D-esterase-like protein [Pseudonocardia endophytica]
MRVGEHDCLTDVAGLRAGHAALDGPGALSGTTVVLVPDGGATAGADVRGAAPGTRETDLLNPQATVQAVHAIVFSGGSAYGLAAATGVMDRLERDGQGFAVPGGVVPIVPAAVLFDLGRGGDFSARPDAALGAAAYDAAGPGPLAQGVVGAGTGAVAGGLKGGVGTAGVVLDSGHTVSALVVVNAVGSAVDAATGELLGVRSGLPGEFDDLPSPSDAAIGALREAGTPQGFSAGTATSLLLVATDATLDKAGCGRMATMAHDGLARAIRPVHTVMDGDAAFALATGTRPAPDLAATFALHAAAADVVSRAVVHAMLAAEPAGRWPSYRSLVG